MARERTVLRTSPGAAGRPAPEEETVSVLGRTNGGDQDTEREGEWRRGLLRRWPVELESFTGQSVEIIFQNFSRFIFFELQI